MLLSLASVVLKAQSDGRTCSADSTSLRAVVGITCALSMMGSLLIILSYCLIPGIRTRGREILFNLSLMDFVAAAGNCAGIAINFDHYLRNSTTDSHTVMKRVCLAQAIFSQYGTVSSILWTICLAVYIYLCIMVARKKIVSWSVPVFYVLSYGLPLIVSAWYGSTGKLGYDYIGGSGWCTVKLSFEGSQRLLSPFFTNDIWIYLTIFLVPVIFLALHFHLKFEKAKNRSILTQNWKATMNNVEIKLLLIPIIFILLRIWSLLLVIIAVEAKYDLNCGAVKFFLYISGVGDSGQGFFNGILFVLFSHKVRSYFMNLCICCKANSLRSVTLQSDQPNTFYNSFSSDVRQSEDKETSDNDSIDGSFNSRHHKSLLLNS